MATCKVCGKSEKRVSKALGACAWCIVERYEDTLPLILEAHKRSREKYGLPINPPKSPQGVPCKICHNLCVMAEGERGYCGTKQIRGGKLIPSNYVGNLSFYHDPLPTNCVADWVCPGGSGAGYPKYSHNKGPEYGYKNLAVFLHSCSFNCLFCQNWHFKIYSINCTYVDVHELAEAVDNRTSCICFFGGDPSCQMPFIIEFSKFILNQKRDVILRICLETNGFMSKELLKEIFDVILPTGGCIKFDLKAWDSKLHFALTGKENKFVLKNFEYIASRIHERPFPYPLVASTLLVPGYVEEDEVRNIAGFIAHLNPEIPYNLLGFYPQFYMEDLPRTSREMAFRCYEVAKKEGLKNVKIGNLGCLV